MTPERKVKQRIVNYLKSHDIYYEAREAGGLTYRKGLPDIWIVYKGKHIEIEIKAPGGVMSTMQIKWAEIFHNKEIACYCIDSVEDLEKILKIE